MKWQGLDLHGFLCLLSQGSLISSMFIDFNDMIRGAFHQAFCKCFFTDNCYKLLKSLHLIGWEQICQWKTLTKRLMKCLPGLSIGWTTQVPAPPPGTASSCCWWANQLSNSVARRGRGGGGKIAPPPNNAFSEFCRYSLEICRYM